MLYTIRKFFASRRKNWELIGLLKDGHYLPAWWDIRSDEDDYSLSFDDLMMLGINEETESGLVAMLVKDLKKDYEHLHRVKSIWMANFAIKVYFDEGENAARYSKYVKLTSGWHTLSWLRYVVKASKKFDLASEEEKWLYYRV